MLYVLIEEVVEEEVDERLKGREGTARKALACFVGGKRKGERERKGW